LVSNIKGGSETGGVLRTGCIIGMFMSRRWAKYVAGIGKYRNAHKVFVENQVKRDQWEHLDVGEMIIFSGIFKKLIGVVWNALSWLRIWTSGAHL
jgi:hypothetical protein